MKVKVSDLTRIVQRFNAENILEAEVTDNGIKGSVTVNGTETKLTVEFLSKLDGTPGLRVSRNVVTKTTLLDEGV